MIPMLCHLLGDYVLQSQPMADRKTSSLLWAAVHASFYTLPFLFLTHDLWRLAIIGGTHMVIDRYRLAARWCAFYGTGTRASGLWAPCNVSTDPVPPFLAVWLTIIVDNTMHLIINAGALS